MIKEYIAKNEGGGVVLILPHEIVDMQNGYKPITQELLETYKGDFIVQSIDLPDRKDRGAWSLSNGKVIVDVDKVKAIKIKKIEDEAEAQKARVSMSPTLLAEIETEKQKQLAELL